MFAIAEFGSTTRKTHDCHSDRDLLVVCELKSSRKYVQKYREQGYSVTLLTPNQLRFMQKSGSLFIQHLKHESRIVMDTNSEFLKWISNCPLIVPSRKEIQRCISTLEFISGWPSDDRLTGWKADFLYCVSRDLLIKWLAGKGVLAFGLEDLEPAVLSQKGDLLESFDNLRLLRESKAAYRSDQETPSGTIETINAWLVEIARVFNVNLPIEKFPTSEESVSSLRMRRFSSSYELLRSVEAAYHIVRSHGLVHPDHEELVKHIRNPNAYGSSQLRKRRVIEQYLAEIIQIMANNGLQGTLRFATRP